MKTCHQGLSKTLRPWQLEKSTSPGASWTSRGDHEDRDSFQLRKPRPSVAVRGTIARLLVQLPITFMPPHDYRIRATRSANPPDLENTMMKPRLPSLVSLLTHFLHSHLSTHAVSPQAGHTHVAGFTVFDLTEILRDIAGDPIVLHHLSTKC